MLYSRWLSRVLACLFLRVCVCSVMSDCDPMDCSLPGSSAYGILQARILEWVAISFSWGSSWPRDGTLISRTGRRILYRLSHQGSPTLWTKKVKSLSAILETWVQSLGQEDPQEKEIAIHSSILAWRIPLTEESGVAKNLTQLSN